MYKKLLFSLAIMGSYLNAKIMYNPISKEYYSTKMNSHHDKTRYNFLAIYTTRMINFAYLQDIDIQKIIDSIKTTLLVDGSAEADLLYNDIMEEWK